MDPAEMEATFDTACDHCGFAFCLCSPDPDFAQTQDQRKNSVSSSSAGSTVANEMACTAEAEAFITRYSSRPFCGFCQETLKLKISERRKSRKHIKGSATASKRELLRLAYECEIRDLAPYFLRKKGAKHETHVDNIQDILSQKLPSKTSNSPPSTPLANEKIVKIAKPNAMCMTVLVPDYQSLHTQIRDNILQQFKLSYIPSNEPLPNYTSGNDPFPITDNKTLDFYLTYDSKPVVTILPTALQPNTLNRQNFQLVDPPASNNNNNNNNNFNGYTQNAQTNTQNFPSNSVFSNNYHSYPTSAPSYQHAVDFSMFLNDSNSNIPSSPPRSTSPSDRQSLNISIGSLDSNAFVPASSPHSIMRPSDPWKMSPLESSMHGLSLEDKVQIVIRCATHEAAEMFSQLSEQLPKLFKEVILIHQVRLILTKHSDSFFGTIAVKEKLATEYGTKLQPSFNPPSFVYLPCQNI